MPRDILTWKSVLNVGCGRIQLFEATFLEPRTGDSFGPWKQGQQVSLLEIDFMEGTMTGSVEGRDGLVTWHWFMTACDDG